MNLNKKVAYKWIYAESLEKILNFGISGCLILTYITGFE